MMAFFERFARRPSPELLAAYADGELDAAARARVEAWLTRYPSLRTELIAQRALSRRNGRLWDHAAPPAPTDRIWVGFTSRVRETILNPPTPAAAPARWSRTWDLAGTVALAAAVIAGVFSLAAVAPRPNRYTSDTIDVAWSVASASEVDIQSIEENDTDLLVVGVPPLTGAVVLAGPGDVQLEKVARDTDGMMPPAMAGGPNMPMLVVPVAAR